MGIGCGFRRLRGRNFIRGFGVGLRISSFRVRARDRGVRERVSFLLCARFRFRIGVLFG